MRVKRIVGGPISAMLLLSVPIIALLALSPWSAASAVGAPSQFDDLAANAPATGAATTGDMKIDELSDWQYTGKSMKSAKSEKSKKSPKSHKSHKSHKSQKSHKSTKPPKKH